MPLTPKGAKILRAMKDQYGEEKGERVFYASANKGTIAGVHHSLPGDSAEYHQMAPTRTPDSPLGEPRDPMLVWANGPVGLPDAPDEYAELGWSHVTPEAQAAALRAFEAIEKAGMGKGHGSLVQESPKMGEV